MQLILLEKVANLGNLGDKVNVKAGYGRNYLLPYGKATAATAANLAAFEERRAELEKAAQLGLDYVTLSPVNQTLSHPDADALGWPKFSQWLSDYPIPVYALGGMQMDDLDIARRHGAHGIALQRAVWKVI